MGANMKLMACAVVAMSMLAGAAQAGEWRLVFLSSNRVDLVDMSTIRNIPYTQKKLAWTAQLLPSTNSKGIDYFLVQYEFDCGSMTSSALSFNTYNLDGLLSASNERIREEHVIPESIGYGLFKATCDGSDQRYFSSVREALEIYRKAFSEGG